MVSTITLLIYMFQRNLLNCIGQHLDGTILQMSMDLGMILSLFLMKRHSMVILL